MKERRMKRMFGQNWESEGEPEPESPESVKQEELNLPPDLLEADLPRNTYEFLGEVFEKCMKAPSGITAILEALENSDIIDKLRDMMLVNESYSEIAEREVKSAEGRDFRQDLGWQSWLFLLAFYRYALSPGRDAETSAKLENSLAHQADMLEVTVTEACGVGDEDTLLLAAGFCQWVGWLKWRDELLNIVREQISDKAIYERLQRMQQHPLMLIEGLLLHNSTKAMKRAK